MNDNWLGGPAQAWRIATDFVRDRRRARQTLDEIGALDANEAARVLGEAGLAPREFAGFMARPFASEDPLLAAMDSVAIDADEFCVRNPAWFQDMERTCMRCRVRGRCRRLLARGEFARTHRDFCPNAGDLAGILSDLSRGPAGHSEVPRRDPEATFRPRATRSGNGG